MMESASEEVVRYARAPLIYGAVLGASAAVAAARRRRPRRRRRETPAGLAAFEDAPCYRETLEKESAST